MDYLVLSKAEWRTSPQELASHLRARWPDVILQDVSGADSSESLRFKLKMTHSELWGTLFSQGKGIFFEGDLCDVAEFALWFRSLVPASEPLLFCDEAMNGSLDLEPGTTQDDIFRLYGYAPGRGKG
ncbi:MAG: hypothetical protein ACXU86_11600 [Archangium sp.]